MRHRIQCAAFGEQSCRLLSHRLRHDLREQIVCLELKIGLAAIEIEWFFIVGSDLWP